MENQAQAVKSTSARAGFIEAIMFFTYAFFAVSWIAGSSLTPQIMEYFKLESFASATFISNAITIAKIIGNFMAAAILAKLYPKRAIMLGSGLIVVGSLIAIFSQQYWMFILGRFIMGFGGALYVVYFSPVVLHYFKKEQLVTVNALNSVAYNVGGIMAMLMVGPVVSWLKTWQYSMGFFAIISAILFVLWPFVGQNFELNKSSGVQQEKYTIGEALKDKFNWVFPFTYSGLLTFYIVLLNIFPISGTTVIASKTLSMLVAIGGVVGTILAIMMGKKYTKRLPVIRWCGLAMTLFGVLMFFDEPGSGSCRGSRDRDLHVPACHIPRSDSTGASEHDPGEAYDDHGSVLGDLLHHRIGRLLYYRDRYRQLRLYDRSDDRPRDERDILHRLLPPSGNRESIR